MVKGRRIEKRSEGCTRQKKKGWMGELLKNWRGRKQGEEGERSKDRKKENEEKRDGGVKADTSVFRRCSWKDQGEEKKK